MLTLPQLPPVNLPSNVKEAVGLIDVIWLEPGSGGKVSAFEVEKRTSIYWGILRLEDLARSIPGCAGLYLVAPVHGEKEVMAQLAEPAFRADLVDIPFAYISLDDV